MVAAGRVRACALQPKPQGLPSGVLLPMQSNMQPLWETWISHLHRTWLRNCCGDYGSKCGGGGGRRRRSRRRRTQPADDRRRRRNPPTPSGGGGSGAIVTVFHQTSPQACKQLACKQIASASISVRPCCDLATEGHREVFLPTWIRWPLWRSHLLCLLPAGAFEFEAHKRFQATKTKAIGTRSQSGCVIQALLLHQILIKF